MSNDPKVKINTKISLIGLVTSDYPKTKIKTKTKTKTNTSFIGQVTSDDPKGRVRRLCDQFGGIILLHHLAQPFKLNKNQTRKINKNKFSKKSSATVIAILRQSLPSGIPPPEVCPPAEQVHQRR